MTKTEYLANPEALLAALARLFASAGAAREVAILTYSVPEIGEPHHDNWNGGTDYYPLTLHVPLKIFTQIESDIEDIEESINKRLALFSDDSNSNQISNAKLRPAVVVDPEWRAKAHAWLSGKTLTNQGRVRSNNIAPHEVDGLLFRSRQEINLYRALKSKGVSFAPLPVFVRGGESYQRIEPDFVIVHGGIVAVVEVDGDTVHTESPAEAHARTSMLQHEGTHVERVTAAQCDTVEKASKVADTIMRTLARIKAAR